MCCINLLITHHLGADNKCSLMDFSLGKCWKMLQNKAVNNSREPRPSRQAQLTSKLWCPSFTSTSVFLSSPEDSECQDPLGYESHIPVSIPWGLQKPWLRCVRTFERPDLSGKPGHLHFSLVTCKCYHLSFIMVLGIRHNILTALGIYILKVDMVTVRNVSMFVSLKEQSHPSEALLGLYPFGVR